MPLTNQKLTRPLTRSKTPGSSMLSYSGWVTGMYGRAGNLWKVSSMYQKWSMSFINTNNQSRDSYRTWRSGIGYFLCGVLTSSNFPTDVLPLYILLAWDITTNHWWWSIPVHWIHHELAHRALFRCGNYYCCMEAYPSGCYLFFSVFCCLYLFVATQGVCS